MTLKELLGKLYKEGMTLEEIDEALSDKDLVDKKTLPKTVSKDRFDEVASEVAKYKKQVKELETKNMSDEEKIQAELKSAEEMKTQYQTEMYKLKAKEVFVGGGLSEEEYSSLVDMVIGQDEKATIEQAKKIVGLISSQKETAKKQMESDLINNTKKPGATSETSDSVTFDNFAKMDWYDRTTFKNENPELFQEFSEKEMKMEDK